MHARRGETGHDTDGDGSDRVRRGKLRHDAHGGDAEAAADHAAQQRDPLVRQRARFPREPENEADDRDGSSGVKAFEWHSQDLRLKEIKDDVAPTLSAGMGMGGANMQQLARQAQKLQQQMLKVQEEVEAREFTASAGGGMVSVKVNGKKEILGLEIKPEAVDPDDIEMLQDMILAAANEALREAGDTVEREMGKLTGGMGIPGLF